MDRTISPVTGPLDAVVSVPGSKSIANRALVCAALAEGECTLRNLPDGDDTVAMLDCLARLGVAVAQDDDRAVVAGRGGRLDEGPIVLPTRLAGTTSRFLTALAVLGPGPYVIDGEAPLRSRPMAALHNALMDLGANVTPLERPGHLPVRVWQADGLRTDPSVEVRGDISSQFISALMMIAPYLSGGLEIRLSTELVSRPYVEMTASVMASFGVDGVSIEDRDRTTIVVPEGRYRAVDLSIEADASSASYPFAAAAIAGGSVTVRGLAPTSVQSDIRFVDALVNMGCTVDNTEEGLTVSRRGSLNGITIDMRDFSDTAPTLAVVAAVAESPTRITGIGFIRGKESDRIGDVVAELRRCGVDAEPEDDGLIVRPGLLGPARVETHHDHRIAMAFALLGLVTPGIAIADPGVVSKSFPGYWQVLDEIAASGGPAA